MGFKSSNSLKRAVAPLDLDRPFIAISKYYVEDRCFRNYSHSNSIMATCGVHKTANAALFKLTHYLEFNHARMSRRHRCRPAASTGTDKNVTPSTLRICMVAQSNETPSLFSVRQITRHGRLERTRSKERANEFGIPTEDGTFTHAPTFVKLTTVQSKTDELLFKMILAPFNVRVR